MPNLALELGKITASLGVKNAYGEVTDLDGVKVIPVALAWSGFGAGEANDEGSGGGGGGASVPLGAYVRDGSTVRFVPNIIPLIVVAVPFVWVAGRAIVRVIRALKRR